LTQPEYLRVLDDSKLGREAPKLMRYDAVFPVVKLVVRDKKDGRELEA
jgi:hypothetical protein